MLPIFSVLYGLGAALALLSLLNVTNVWAVGCLAIASTGAMFAIFRFLPSCSALSRQLALRRSVGGHSMLLSAFAMIAVLSSTVVD